MIIVPILFYLFAALVLFLSPFIVECEPSQYEQSVSTKELNMNEKYIVLIVSRLGLANRLRSLADWHQIAILSNRKLLVSWEATSDCNATYSDLFESGPSRLSILTYTLPAGNEGIQSVERSAARMGLTSLALYEGSDQHSNMWVGRHKSFLLSRDIVLNDRQVVITSYDGVVALEGVSCQQYMIQHSEFLAALHPVAEISAFVQDFISTYYTEAGKILIGIHIRTHEKEQDWAVVPPLMGQQQARRFGEGASLDDFTSAMWRIHNRFALNVSSNTPPHHTSDNLSQPTGSPRYDDLDISSDASKRQQDNQEQPRESAVRFFIASNRDELKRLLLDRFPGSLSLSGDYARFSPAGMRLALAEWLLLSHSALLLNTYGSSFAMEAAQVRRRPLVGIWEGLLVHHTSLLLPYCGHLQFIKAYSNQGLPNAYREGAIDNREVILIADKIWCVLMLFTVFPVFVIAAVPGDFSAISSLALNNTTSHPINILM